MGFPDPRSTSNPSLDAPRVLVVAHNPFNRGVGNGLTLTSLFEGWPRERLAQIYTPFATAIPPEFDVCPRYWRLSPLGLAPVLPPAEAPPAETPARPSRPSAARRGAEWLARRPGVRAWSLPVREALYSQPLTRRGAGWREVAAFAPDVLFTTLGSLNCARVVLRLSDRLGVPVVPFVTDDWARTEYHGAPRGAAMRRELDALFRDVLGRSPRALVISAPMADEYAQRYGRPFETMVRCVDPALFDPAPRAAGGPLELVYAGQLTLGRWDVLTSVAEHLLALRRAGVDARLSVYSPTAQPLGAALAPVVRMMGTVPNACLPDVYSGADVLVHVESDDPAIAAYTRLSVSTKIPEYLMAGRAVLGVGPAGLASLRHLAASGGAVLAQADAVGEPLARLLGDADLRADLAARGRRFALREHDADTQRLRFRRILAAAA